MTVTPKALKEAMEKHIIILERMIRPFYLMSAKALKVSSSFP